MPNYCVDTTVLREQISELKKIKNIYNGYLNLKAPKANKKASGKVQDDLIILVEKIQQTWKYLFELNEKTVSFLNGEVDRLESLDKEGASGMQK